MFDSVDGMRAYLQARGWTLKNERLFVGRICSFFTQNNEVYGLSSVAVAKGAGPDFRGHVLEDRKMLLVFPSAKKAELAGRHQIWVDVDVASAAEAWNIPELAFMPGASVRVRYDNPVAIQNNDAK